LNRLPGKSVQGGGRVLSYPDEMEYGTN
jgi:hypothetical protein